MPKNAPKVRDAEVTRAFEHTYKDINELIMSVNGLSSKSNREGYKGKNGDMRLYRDLRTKQYFFEGRFDDGWAQVELDLAKKTNTTTVATSGDTNVQSDWNVSDNTSDAFIKNKPTVQYTSAIPSMGSGNSYAAGLTPAGSGTHSDTYLRKDGTWATPLNTTYSVMASGNSYAAGLVPAGSGTHNNTFLRKDGTWVAPSSGIALTDLSASTPITYDNSSGAFSIGDHAVALAKLPEIASARFLGRNTSGTGDVEVMTVGQVGALLSLDTYLTAVSQSDVTQHQGAIDHDQLLNFAANEHIDWTADQGSTNIHSGNYTNTVDMGDGFRFVYVDGNVQVTENKYLKLKTVDGSRGFGSLEAGGDGSSSSPWIITLPTPDTNTTYSAMGSGNGYAAGLVLAGSATHNNNFLRKDGSWELPNINLQDDDSDSVSVTINSHVKITGTGGISTDWTTDDAGGAGNAPNVLTIGLGSITQVGALSQGSIASGFTTIDEGFIDSAIVRKNANTTITGNYTFSGKGIIINAGSGDSVTGYDASLYITATSSNDWGMWINKASYNYGLKVETASDATRAIVVRSSSANRFIVDGAGVVTWKDGGSANANTAYSWGDHGTEGYLKNITGQSISNLNDVNSISGISNGQVLVWNSTANAFQPGSSSYSWYLVDGDTTTVEVTSGKYVKLVEGTGIDINFTDTSSGVVDDEYDVTITNTLMSSGGTISGDLAISDYESKLTLTKTRNTTQSFHIAHENDDGVLDFLRESTRTARITNNGRWVIGGHAEVESSQLSVQGNLGVTGLAYFKYGSSSNDNVRFYNQDGSYSYIRVTANGNNANTWFDTRLGSTTWFGWTNTGGSGVSSWHFGTGGSTGANSVLISSGAILQYNSSGNHTTTLNADGSATFAGTVLISGVSNYTGLEVKGSGGSRPQVKFTNVNNGTLGGIYGTESNALIIGTGSSNTTALTLDSSQNATFAGNIVGKTNTHISYSSGNATTTATGGAFNASGSDIVTGRLFLQGYQNSGNDLIGFNNETNQLVMYNYTDGAYLVKFEHDGDVVLKKQLSISTGSSSVYPSIVGSTSDYELFRLEQWYGNEGALIIKNNGNTKIRLTGGQSNVVSYINNGANFAIGGTGGYQKLSVEGGNIYMSTGYQITWSNGNATLYESGYSLRFSTYNGSSAVVERMRIESDGDVHCDADVIAYSNTIGSDRRLKKNIEDISYGLDDVLKLRGVEFDWNRKDYAKKHDVGFIAQEVREVIPELVKRTSGLNDKGSFLTVDYAKLVPVLVESIKELKQEIEDLRNEKL